MDINEEIAALEKQLKPPAAKSVRENELTNLAAAKAHLEESIRVRKSKLGDLDGETKLNFLRGIQFEEAKLREIVRRTEQIAPKKETQPTPQT